MGKEEEIKENIERLTKELTDVFNSEEGKQWLEENRQRTIKEAKNNTGWFSKEEDEAWAYLNNNEEI